MPLNIQQRPLLFWSVMDWLGVSMLKWVSSSDALAWFLARLSMLLAAMALARARSVLDMLWFFWIDWSICVEMPPLACAMQFALMAKAKENTVSFWIIV